MARTVLDENIRNERIVLVGEYVKKNKASTRKAAEFFSKTQFTISNATVSDYIIRFSKMKKNEIEDIKNKIEKNAKEEIKDSKVAERVVKAGELFASSYNVDDIVDILKSSYWDIYGDLTKRLKYANKKLYGEVKTLLDSEIDTRPRKKKNGK